MSMVDDCDDVFSVSLFLSFTEIAFQNSSLTPFYMLVEPFTFHWASIGSNMEIYGVFSVLPIP